MSLLNRPRLALTILSTFSGARQAHFLVTTLPATLNTCSLLLLATMVWIRLLSVECILQTNKSSKWYEIYQTYELKRKLSKTTKRIFSVNGGVGVPPISAKGFQQSPQPTQNF